MEEGGAYAAVGTEHVLAGELGEASVAPAGQPREWIVPRARGQVWHGGCRPRRAAAGRRLRVLSLVAGGPPDQVHGVGVLDLVASKRVAIFQDPSRIYQALAFGRDVGVVFGGELLLQGGDGGGEGQREVVLGVGGGLDAEGDGCVLGSVVVRHGGLQCSEVSGKAGQS